MKFRYDGRRIDKTFTLVRNGHSTELSRYREDIEVEDFTEDGGGICISVYDDDDDGTVYEVYLTNDLEPDYVNVYRLYDYRFTDRIESGDIRIEKY